MTDKEQALLDFEEYARNMCFPVGSFGYIVAKEAWMAALQGIIEPREPTPTEMVKALLEKGWTLKPGRDMHDLCLEDPKTNILYSFIDSNIEKAYRRASPRKKKITVDVWYKEGMIREFDYFGLCENKEWIPGTATFEVPEEE